METQLHVFASAPNKIENFAKTSGNFSKQHFYLNQKSYFRIDVNEEMSVKGRNQNLQLGIEPDNDIEKWTIHKFFKGKNLPKLISNSVNANHVFIYTKSNKLFCFGSHFNDTEKVIHEITHIKLNSSLKSIASGFNFSLFLSINGIVYGVGSNDYGEIGQPSTICNTTSYKILKIEKLSNIKQIQCCDNSSYALNENGQIFSFGDNLFGELGISSRLTSDNHYQIHKVLIENEIIYISAGGCHVCCIDKNKNIFVFGANDEGECGLSREIKKIFEPKKLIIKNEMIHTIQCGYTHTIFTTENDKFYSCGTNKQNECLLFLNDENDEDVFQPQLISTQKISQFIDQETIVKLIAGRNETFIVTSPQCFI